MDEKDRLKWIYSSKDNRELCERYNRWAIYSSKDNRELCERYNRWAKDYDSELEEDYGWLAPQIVTGCVTKYVPKEARILDAGAGTGLVGQCLYHGGYRNLVAIDLSEGMLEKARDKKVYGELYQMVLGESLAFPDDSWFVSPSPRDTSYSRNGLMRMQPWDSKKGRQNWNLPGDGSWLKVILTEHFPSRSRMRPVRSGCIR